MCVRFRKGLRKEVPGYWSIIRASQLETEQQGNIAQIDDQIAHMHFTVIHYGLG